MKFSLLRCLRLGFIGSRSNLAAMAAVTTGEKSQAREAKSNWEDDRHLRMVWVDLEMTGLDIEKDTIIEIACVITDQNLNVIAEGPNLVIHQSDEVMNSMGDWCKKHHGESGLTAAVKKSTITLNDAEQQVLKFVKQHVPSKCCPLAGNSVHADKKFLEKYMPTFSEYLHYRIIDVSSVKELARRWYPGICNLSWKKRCHRSLDDILESIEELKQYRASIFK